MYKCSIIYLANEHLTNKLNSTLKLHDDTIEQLKAEISALEQNTNQLKEDVVFKGKISKLSAQINTRKSCLMLEIKCLMFFI